MAAPGFQHNGPADPGAGLPDRPPGDPDPAPLPDGEGALVGPGQGDAVGFHLVGVEMAGDEGLPGRFGGRRPERLPGEPQLVVLVAGVQGPLEPGGYYDKVADGFLVRVRDVAPAFCRLSFAVSNRFYGKAVPVRQIVWPDPRGRFPGDPGCDPGMAAAQDIGGTST